MKRLNVRRMRLIVALCAVMTSLVAGHDSAVPISAASSHSISRDTAAGIGASVSIGATQVGGAQAAFAGMSEAQRIGQLFMVGSSASAASPATLAAISNYHVGNVILTGRSAAGVTSTRSVTNALQARASVAATSGVPLLIGADQEGGHVQALSGPGFSSIPTALTQGSWPASTVQNDARNWGAQLAAAGVNLDLAPVMDTVPSGFVNPPIGSLDREFGNTPGPVGTHGTAFAQGMAQAGLGATVKHFPGLGRVDANTDTSQGVTDSVTTFDDAYLAPFKTAIQAGAPFAMVSLAYYHLIDPTRPAVFSPTVIGGMLRSELGFSGVVMSDDLGVANQVAAWSPGDRAVDFVNAGGDLILTVAPSVLPAMVNAVTAAVARSASFRAKVDAAALLVLEAKQALGLIPSAQFVGDFNGDGKSDVAVWRPSTGTWWIRGIETVRWGQAGDIPITGDFNGDRSTDLAVWRPSTGTWWIRGIETVSWGQAGDAPV